MTNPTRIRIPGTAFIDFESRSRCALKKRGGRNYWSDPSTEAICAVLHDVDRGAQHIWVPGDPPPVLGIAVAHNGAMFDRFAAAKYGWRVGAWLDSSHLAKRSGLPGALDKLAQRLLGRGKDKTGNRFTLALSRPSRAAATRGAMPELTPAVVERVVQYCANDVGVMVDAWPELADWADVDVEVAAVDLAINDRGIALDADLVRALQAQLVRLQGIAVRGAARALGWSEADTWRGARSVPIFRRATGLPNAQKETLAAAVATGRIHPLVQARAALASVAPGKLAAALQFANADGRVRDSHLYYGAHTGRWSSKGIQLHNLPRVSFEKACTGRYADWAMQDYIEALADYALAGGEVSAREVSGLLRSVLVASPGCELQVLDYSGIESRATAWAAGDEAALQVFAAYDGGTGPDPYCVAATGIFGYPVNKTEDPEERGLGKIAELGLGYQMGAPKFAATCAKAGVDLAKMGLSAERVVASWRKLRRAVVQLWYACQRAFVRAAEGRRSVVGPWVYDSMGERDVVCVLPSGRPIVYRDVHVRHGDRGPSCSYQGRKKWREHVYGGKLVENAVQATCRDLLAQALVRLEHDGLSPVLHVHDEAVCQNAASASAEALAEMRRIMSDAPEWAEGIPLAFDGFKGRRYRK